MSNFFNSLMEIIFPTHCLFCHRKDNNIFCFECQKKINFIQPPYCLSCGKKAEGKITNFSLCGICHKEEIHFDCTRSIGKYEDIFKEAIHKFKYQGKKKLAEPLGNLMTEFLQKNRFIKGTPPETPELLEKYSFPHYQEIERIIPVPLHPKRLKERGFNQSELLAEVINKNLKIPIFNNVLIRTKETSPQINLSKKERKENIKGAFSLSNGEEIKARVILLIDDIITTGATINECAKTLRRAKVKKIFALTLAHG